MAGGGTFVRWCSWQRQSVWPGWEYCQTPGKALAASPFDCENDGVPLPATSLNDSVSHYTVSCQLEEMVQIFGALNLRTVGLIIP